MKLRTFVKHMNRYARNYNLYMKRGCPPGMDKGLQRSCNVFYNVPIDTFSGLLSERLYRRKWHPRNREIRDTVLRIHRGTSKLR